VSTLIASFGAVPVVGALAYRGALAGVAERFTATLLVEPENRYNPGAVSVHLPGGAKAGYIAPDIGRHLAPVVAARATRGEPTTCPARLISPGPRVDVRILLDFGTADDLHL
jgi:hypothetical protein